MAKSRRRPKARGSRSTETRNPLTPQKDASPIVFSLKYFVDVDDVGQSINKWVENSPKLLGGLMEKIKHLSQKYTNNVEQDGVLQLYGSFPNKANSEFACPIGLEHKNWGVIRRISGQQQRVAGFLEDNVFYIVYLDEEHKFWKSKKKNT